MMLYARTLDSPPIGPLCLFVVLMACSPVTLGFCTFKTPAEGDQAGALDPDLPGFPTQLQTFQAGSYVIAMDNTWQSFDSPATVFTEKAYGLLYELLKEKIPLEWAIKSGKSKDDIDFTAGCDRKYPVASTLASNCSFKAGPFLIHLRHTERADAVINSWNTLHSTERTAVYTLDNDETIDIRYHVTFKPQVGLVDNGGNADKHQTMLEFAGLVENDAFTITDYDTVTSDSCWTLAAEAHWGGGGTEVAILGDVQAFLESGGNVLSECDGIHTYERVGKLQATNDFKHAGVGSNDLTYLNSDISISQWDGTFDGAAGGSYSDWYPDPDAVPPSEWRSNTVLVVQNNGVTPISYAVTARKLARGIPGGIVVYLGSHKHESDTIESANARRVLFNTMFTPVVRPRLCGLHFEADVAVVPKDENATLVAFVNTEFVEEFIIFNNGPGNTDIAMNFSIPLAVQLISVNITPPDGNCTFNNVTRVGYCWFPGLAPCDNVTLSITTISSNINVTIGSNVAAEGSIDDPDPENNVYNSGSIVEPYVFVEPNSGCVQPGDVLNVSIALGPPLADPVLDGPCLVHGIDVSSTFVATPTTEHPHLYSVTYLPIEGQGDWFQGQLQISCPLRSPTTGANLIIDTINDGNTLRGDLSGPAFNCTDLFVCGDGKLDGSESCDDGNDIAGDGCSSSTCTVEPGYSCSGVPSNCSTVCGDGYHSTSTEECDDGNTAPGDGCDMNCAVEDNYVCYGTPLSFCRQKKPFKCWHTLESEHPECCSLVTDDCPEHILIKPAY
eukprot:TRINITY_DN10858_c0_g1_i1.p1 TRINITY_DN10858_c0_g1~~TRINITY_DN10858_c0_g1_i1.p1  ORF type:complete len:783 (-),score=82.84 TRINITY_DN10858_c0_g1_i1:736-3084(-)